MGLYEPLRPGWGRALETKAKHAQKGKTGPCVRGLPARARDLRAPIRGQGADPCPGSGKARLLLSNVCGPGGTCHEETNLEKNTVHAPLCGGRLLSRRVAADRSEGHDHRRNGLYRPGGHLRHHVFLEEGPSPHGQILRQRGEPSLLPDPHHLGRYLLLVHRPDLQESLA